MINIQKNWQTVKIRDVCKVASGATPKTTESSFWSGDIPWITPMDLSKLNSRYITNGARNITDKGFKNCSAELLPPQSLIMSSRAPIGYLAINTNQATTNQGCKTFICGNRIHVEFLYYYLSHNLDAIKRLGSGSTFAEVGKKHLEDFTIKIPPKPIQEKAAIVLGEVDNLIDKTNQIIQKTELLKKGLMQELFTKRIGNSSFKKIKLGEVVKFIDYRGKTPKKESQGIPLITAKNIRMGFIKPEPKEYISPDSYDAWMTRGLPKFGDVLFTTEAPLGNVAQIQTQDPLAFAQRVIIFQPNNQLNSTFLMYLLMSDKIQKELNALASGGTVKGIKAKVLKQIELPILSLIEQKKIAEILKSIDEKIAVNKKMKEKLLLLKIGFMHDIFNQKVEIY